METPNKNTTKSFESAYKNLNKGQKQAVDAIEGPVMVVAGPGTGKTTLLTLRIANILRQTDAQPENILALTFTNSGVRAMRNKLLEYIGDDAYRVGIYTFHSFAENIIREFSSYFENMEGANVIGDLDKVKIIEEIIKEGKFKEVVSSYDPFLSINQIIGAINDLKKEGLDPHDFSARIPEWEKELLDDENILYKRNTGKNKKGEIKPSEKDKIDKQIAKAKEIAEIFETYQEKITAVGFYDFDDMILNVLNQLEKNENLKFDLQEKYQYLLVDEHQDTNDGQNKLIELLTDAEHLNGHPNLFTVGDEKQSIYRFQGASEETFDHFKKIYKDVEIIDLTENYRSNEGILNAAHELIMETLPSAVSLNSANQKIQSNDKPKVLQFSNYKFELLYVVEDIKNKIAAGENPEDIAIIYRSNKHVSEIRDLLNHNKIPHTILSKDNLFEDPNIENLISILRIIDNLNNNHHVAKSLLINFLNFDPQQVIDVISNFNKQKRDENSGATTLFKFLEENKLTGADNFIKQIKKLKIESANNSFTGFFKFFLEEIGYLDYMLASDDSRDQLLKVDKLFDEIKRQVQASGRNGYGLSDFLSFVDSYKKYGLDIKTENPEVVDGVKLMTAHKSKGLEFKNVYIINSTRNNWEKSRGFNKIKLPIDDYKGDIDDERRLFYVAMTRAKEDLQITSALTDWEGREKEKTQFISEIGDDSLNFVETSDFEKENLDNLAVFVRSSNLSSSLFDKKYLRDLFLQNNLSVTALNNYLECPVKYLFRSLIKIPSEYDSNLVYGDLIHNSLEKFFTQSNKEKKILGKNILIDLYKKEISKSPLFDYEYDRFLEKGQNSLSDYYDNYATQWNINVSTEKHIKRQLELESGEIINISGILDKIEFLESESEGKINIVDYKTGKPYSDKTSKDQKEGLKRQLIFYHLLMDGYNDGKYKIEKSLLDFVEKNKKGDYEQFFVEVSDSDLDELKKVVNEMASEIISGNFLKKGCKKKDCEYCKLAKFL